MISDIILLLPLTLVNKIKTIAVLLEHDNSLIQLEKEIMGERLTGLYKSLDDILGKYSSSNKLSQEVRIVSAEARENVRKLEEMGGNLSRVSKEKDELMNNHIELTESKLDLVSQRDKLIKAFKDKQNSIQKELSNATEERETMKSKLAELEKKLFDVSEEFKRHRQKFKIKHSSLEDAEEKFCKNCQKSFHERDNFNWSCRVHASKLTGDYYWCCGKVGKDSVGCIVAKHRSKEEEEEKDEETITTGSKFCSVM